MLRYLTVDSYESTTHPYTIDNNKKIIKIFKPNINIDNKMKKIKLIKERTSNLDFIITADYIVTNNNKEIGYIMPYFDGKEINYDKNNKNFKKNYIILKEISKDLEIIHKLNIIAADFSSNILIDNNNNIKFIDYDNFAIDNLDVDSKNVILLKYLNKFKKLDYNFDNYLLNLLTISCSTGINLYDLFLLNYCDKIYHTSDENINNIIKNTLFINSFNSKSYTENKIIDNIKNSNKMKKIKLIKY